jgi:hypothetical protein
LGQGFYITTIPRVKTHQRTDFSPSFEGWPRPTKPDNLAVQTASHSALEGDKGMRRLAIGLSLVLFLTACDSPILTNKYQLVASSDGNTYRLDKSSGKVWLINGNKIEEVATKNFQLTIGQRYMGADQYFFTYSGKGQFTEVKSFDDEMVQYYK